MTPPLPAPSQPYADDVAGATWSSSGNLQTSGEPLQYAEYKQWLTINYSRNPQGSEFADVNPYRSLTDLSGTMQKTIHSTSLHIEIIAHTSCTFVWGNYAVSSYVQPQKISINSLETDKAGYTYGEVSSASSNFVFGPLGSIVTTQPYIRRNIKAAQDVEYSLTQTGHSHAMVANSSGTSAQNEWLHVPDVMIPYQNMIKYSYDIPKNPPTDLKWCRAVANSVDTFPIGGGGYNVSAEVGYLNNAAGLARLIQFVEHNSGNLNQSWVPARFVVPSPISSNGKSSPVESDRLATNPYYNVSYHDYN